MKVKDDVRRLYKKISYKARRESMDSEKRNINSVTQMKSGEQQKKCIRYTDLKKSVQRRLNEKHKMLEMKSYISINTQSKCTNPPMKIKIVKLDETKM